MTGRSYSIFDTGIGRCAIAWSPAGIIGVQLPEVREIDTRRRLYQLYPDAASFVRRRTSTLRSKASPRCSAARPAISPMSRSM